MSNLGGSSNTQWDDEALPYSQGDGPENEEDLFFAPQVPDGGYGWVIVFASFMCNLIVDGIVNSFGVFVPHLVKDFGVGKGSVAWAGSFLSGFYLTAGPLVSALTNKFGCRPVCMSGAIVASAGFALSSLSSSLPLLFLTYSIGGIGFGLIYLPAVVCVGYYFESKRAFATGIAVCGSGVGTFIFAPTAGALLSVMNWKSANLIFSGILLCCAGFGGLMRPLEVQLDFLEDNDDENDIDPKPEPLGTFVVQLPDGTKERRQKVPLNQVAATNTSLIEGLPLVVPSDQTSKKNDSGPKLNVSGNSMVSRTGTGGLGLRHSIRAVPLGSNDAKPNSLISSVPSRLNLTQHGTDDELHSILFDRRSGTERRTIVRPMSRKDIFYSGSIVNLPEYRNKAQSYAQSVLNIPKEPEVSKSSKSKGKSCQRKKKSKCKCPQSGAFVSALSQLMDFGLMKNPVFLFIALTQVFGMLGYFIPLFYIADAAESKKVSASNAAFLLSIIGITNTVGRIVTGLLSDQKNVNSLFLHNFCLLMGGIVVGCVPFCNDYYSFIAVAVFFGLFIAGFVSLTSQILVEFLGLDHLTNAFGLVSFFRGIASFIGPPFAGALFDAFQVYSVPFWVAGGFLITSAVVGFSTPFVVRFAPPPELTTPPPIYNVGYLEEDEQGAQKIKN